MLKLLKLINSRIISVLDFYILVIRICFGFRISCFGFYFQSYYTILSLFSLKTKTINKTIPKKTQIAEYPKTNEDPLKLHNVPPIIPAKRLDNPIDAFKNPCPVAKRS